METYGGAEDRITIHNLGTIRKLILIEAFRSFPPSLQVEVGVVPGICQIADMLEQLLYI
jgi:hypothetical protein